MTITITFTDLRFTTQQVSTQIFFGTFYPSSALGVVPGATAQISWTLSLPPRRAVSLIPTVTPSNVVILSPSTLTWSASSAYGASSTVLSVTPPPETLTNVNITICFSTEQSGCGIL